jgi:hypothetical protein
VLRATSARLSAERVTARVESLVRPGRRTGPHRSRRHGQVMAAVKPTGPAARPADRCQLAVNRWPA